MKRILWAALAFLFWAGCSSAPQVNDKVLTEVLTEAEKGGALDAFELTPSPGQKREDDFIVTLLESGEQPRRTLRYDFQPGYRDTMIFEMTVSMKTTMGGMLLQEIRMPTARNHAEVMVTEVMADGSCRYLARYYDVQVIAPADTDPVFLSIYEGEIQKLEGMKISGLISSRGDRSEFITELPQGAPAEMETSLDQATKSILSPAAPFPREKVGVGGRWSISRPVAINNLEGTQTATYEVMEFTDEGVHLSVELIQSFPQQVVEDPNLPEGALVTLEDCVSRSHGFMNLEYRGLVPKLSVVMEMVMEMGVSGMQMEQNVQSELFMDVSARRLESAIQ